MSAKFVLYKRSSQGENIVYLIKNQLAFGEVVNRANERADSYTREVLAESDDLHTLYQLKELAEGEER